MLRASALLLLCLLPLQSGSVPVSGSLPLAAEKAGPVFTADGRLALPGDYREWVFLSSGLDMSYNKTAIDPSMSMFNNVFVNPAAYRAFQQTGVWPEGTALVLENRGAEGSKSINKRGKTQGTDVMGVEIHVKDSAHVKAPGGWGFYAFENEQPAKMIVRSANCYSCHEQHAAVDTTFVQFYPTLQAAAKAHGTFSKAYLAEPAK